MTFQHTLYQIFYGINKFGEKEDISICRANMLMRENVERWLRQSLSEDQNNHSLTKEPQIQSQEPTLSTTTDLPREKQEKPRQQPEIFVPTPTHIPRVIKSKTPKQSIFYPSEKNALFWCVYIGVYGMGEYIINERKRPNVEMQERQKMLDYFRNTANAAKLKQGNVKVSNVLIQEMMSELMVSSRDTNSIFYMCIVMSVFHKKIIYFVRKNKYLVFSYCKEQDEETNIRDTLVIYAKNDRECGLSEETTLSEIQNIVDTKYKLEYYDKPLRGASSYKMSDLNDIARKLNVDLADGEGKVLKKNELYNKVVQHATW